MKKTYHGIINTRAKAMRIAKMLRENNGSTEAIAAASMIERNWHSIAARPACQPAIIAMAETTPLSRKGGIMDILSKGVNQTAVSQ